jgi:2-oxoglutarate dehydrogenase E1 component
LERRRDALGDAGGVDWGHAEALAFGSLLREGISVRMSGQDCERGTFSHRHAVLSDVQTGAKYTPLAAVPQAPVRFDIHNSALSETAVMGFEYGYSVAAADALTLWEAQFGDFANVAQPIIDQFIAADRAKWGQDSALVLLLPHGYEGQGPEHSSARLERFLQLCAEKNMVVGNFTTPAQYFHALRRQKLRGFRKPLILMTPKSLLTRPEAVSTEADFLEGSCFQEVLPDPMPVEDPMQVNRIVFCTGKIYYDLAAYRQEKGITNTAILRIEQLYPFHKELVEALVSQYPAASKFVWCQEEPLNMGAWSYIAPRLEKVLDRRVRYAGRDRASSPAAGSKAMHYREQKALIDAAFTVA